MIRCDGHRWRSDIAEVFVEGAGRVLSSTDPLGRVTRTEPDRLNRTVTVTDPLGGQTHFQYDANSNLLSLTDALNHATTYSYDDDDLVATRADPLQHAATFTYDRNHHAVAQTDRQQQATAFEHDALDRLTKVTFDDASTIAYTYDAGNRVTAIDDSANGAMTRTYDGLDRLTSETTAEGAVTYTYDDDGRRATMDVSGQGTTSYAYDDDHRLLTITQGASVVAFTYDDAHRRQTITYPNDIVGTYGYDEANQLTSLAYTLNNTSVGDLGYTYDLAGNRTTVTGSLARTGLPQPVSATSYDAANRLLVWGGQALSYDLNGNLASDGFTSYTWNARNQLTGLSGATSASFAYDGLERRRSKTVGGGTTNFLYDGENLVQELNSGGVPTANLLTGGIDQTFTRADTSGTSTLLVDALASTLALADANGTVQTQYTFEPFGATTTSGVASTNPAQFTGRENDLDGLYFYRARYLVAGSGRFLSEDPIDFEDGANRYSHVLNNPTGLIDPSGLWPEWLDFTVGFWKDFYRGSTDMYGNYRKMVDTNTKGVDKWFHCMANCEASQRAPGGLLAAQIISELREDYGYWKGDPLGDSLDDMRANRCGRRGDPKCQNRCKQYLPPWFNPGR